MSSAVSTKCTVFNLAVTGSTIRCVMTWLTFLGYLAFFNLDSKILSLSLEFLSLSPIQTLHLSASTQTAAVFAMLAYVQLFVESSINSRVYNDLAQAS